MKSITYIGRHDRVDVDEIGRVDDNGVARGETVEVPDELAGTPPDARFLVIMYEELPAAAARLDHQAQRDLKEELIDLSAGSGLLAAHRQWAPVGKVRKTTAPAAKKAAARQAPGTKKSKAAAAVAASEGVDL